MLFILFKYKNMALKLASKEIYGSFEYSLKADRP